MKKLINLLTVLVMVSVNVFTPFSYANVETGAVIDIEEPVIEQSTVENSEESLEVIGPELSIVLEVESGGVVSMSGLNNDIDIEHGIVELSGGNNIEEEVVVEEQNFLTGEMGDISVDLNKQNFNLDSLEPMGEEMSFTVTYNLNGGYWTENGDKSNKTVSYETNDKGILTNRKTPSKEEGTCNNKNCMFDGWYYTGLKNRWTGHIIDNLTVYAKWLEFEDLEIDGTNIIIMDRNIGAEYAGTDCSPTNTGSCGYHFEFGNNYGFGFDNEILKFGDSVNTQGYEASTFYRNTFPFRVTTYSLDNVGNLRGGEGEDYENTNKNEKDKQGPCPKGYHVPSIGEWNILITELRNPTSNTLISKLKLSNAGYRDYEYGNTTNIGTSGRYWTSTPYKFLNISNSSYYIGYESRPALGGIVRCFKNFPTVTINYIVNGEEYAKEEVRKGEQAKGIEEEPEINDGIFSGWFEENAENPFNFETEINEDKNLYAIFDRSKIIIKFIKNGETIENRIIEKGTKTSAPENMEEIENGELKGWTLEGEETLFDFNTPINENIRLYAKYECDEGYKRNNDVKGCINFKNGLETIIIKDVNNNIIQRYDQEREDLEYYTITETGTEHITLMDRNMGATAISNIGGRPNNNSYGYYYQRGNNYGFTGGENSNTTTSPIEKEIWEKGIPSKYGSNVWFNSSNSWMKDSTTEDGIWGGSGDKVNIEGETTNNIGRKGPCPEGYHIPSAFFSSKFNYDIATKYLLIPYAGQRTTYGTNNGYSFRTSSPFEQYNGNAYQFNSSIYSVSRSYGIPIRCFKNTENNKEIFNIEGISGNKINVSVINDIIINISTINKEGFTFGGWYSTENYETGSEVINGTNISNIETIYPKWKLDIYYKTIDGQTLYYQNIDIGAKAIKPTNDPFRMNATFKGWYNDKEYKNIYNFDENLYESKTLYAKRECNEGYDEIGNQCKKTNTVTFMDGEKVLQIKKIGSGAYLGWPENAYKEGDEQYSGYMIEGFYTDQQLKNKYEFKEVLTGDITLYTKWLGFNDVEATGFIIMDRNLGAKSNNRLNEESYGYYYERGNNYGFTSEDIELERSDTHISVDGQYGPKNNITRGLFVLDEDEYGWGSLNSNLWGGSSNNEEDKQGPCPMGYHIPTGSERNSLKNIYGSNTELKEGIKLPDAGFRLAFSNNLPRVKGSYGYYRTSEMYSSWSANAFFTYYGNVDNNETSDGFSLRCFKNKPIIKFIINGELYKEEKLEQFGDKIDKPEFDLVKQGYELKWYKIGDNTEFNFEEEIKKDTIINGIREPIKYTIKFDINGGKGDVTDINAIYGEEIILPNVTKDGYIFRGWKDENGKIYTNKIGKNESPTIEDGVIVTFTAQWEEDKSNHSSGGGGKRSEPSISEIANDTTQEHNSADDKTAKPTTDTDKTSLNEETIKEVISVTQEIAEDGTEVEVVVEAVAIKNTNIVATVRTETPVNGTTSSTSSSSTHTKEQADAYSFAKANGITTTESIETAKMNTELTRIQMAKMLSNFAINVLGEEPDVSKGTVNFDDVNDKMDEQYDKAVTKAYQLGIMGQNVKDNEFRPNDGVTRAEFTTALSRLLYKTEEGEYKGTNKYYIPHIVKLYNEGIVNKADPSIKEKRGYVMTMLKRSVSK